MALYSKTERKSCGLLRPTIPPGQENVPVSKIGKVPKLVWEDVKLRGSGVVPKVKACYYLPLFHECVSDLGLEEVFSKKTAMAFVVWALDRHKRIEETGKLMARTDAAEQHAHTQSV